MTVRELPWARFDGAARLVRGPLVTPCPMAAVPLRHEIPGSTAVPLPHEIPGSTAETVPSGPPHTGPGPLARPAVPLFAAHIGHVPTAFRVR